MHPTKQYHADANDFLERALSLHFKGAVWHFSHTSAATTWRAEQSKVLQRLAKHEPKLPGSLENGTPLRPTGRAAPAYPTLCAVHGIPPRACPSGRLRARLPCAHCTVTPDTDEELRAVCCDCEAPQRDSGARPCLHVFDHKRG
jgi:hypothetical protein